MATNLCCLTLTSPDAGLETLFKPLVPETAQLWVNVSPPSSVVLITSDDDTPDFPSGVTLVRTPKSS